MVGVRRFVLSLRCRGACGWGQMRGIDRRRFIRAASAVAGAGMSGMAMAQGGDGRAAITKADLEALAR